MAEAARIAYLIAGQWRDTLSASEKEELETWLDSDPANRAFLQNRVKPELFADLLQGLAEMNDERLIKKLWDCIDRPSISNLLHNSSVPVSPQRLAQRSFASIRIFKKRTFIRWTLAATFLGLIIIAGHVIKAHQSKTKLPKFSPYRPDDIKDQLASLSKPVEQPTLSIDHESSLNINNLTETGIAPSNGWNILRIGDRHIVYRNGNYSRRHSPVSNIFALPKGLFNLQVTLPDGSEMDLDPGSSAAYLSYPPGVLAPARRIILNGQASFQVVKDPNSPFMIETEKAEFKVLGTYLNIRDFLGEDTSEVLVQRGKVSVTIDQNYALLDSGQKAHILPSSSLIQVSSITRMPEDRTLQNEPFNFSNKTIPQVMKEIEAWYGVKVVVSSGVDSITPGKLAAGPIGRNVSLMKLLSALKKEDVDFQPFGRTILVTK